VTDLKIDACTAARLAAVHRNEATRERARADAQRWVVAVRDTYKAVLGRQVPLDLTIKLEDRVRQAGRGYSGRYTYVHGKFAVFSADGYLWRVYERDNDRRVMRFTSGERHIRDTYGLQIRMLVKRGRWSWLTGGEWLWFNVEGLETLGDVLKRHEGC
jgi:hypothetical protein